MVCLEVPLAFQLFLSLNLVPGAKVLVHTSLILPLPHCHLSLKERKIISGASCQGGWKLVGVLQMPLRGGREGKGTPLQYSCLENPMDGGAWWAAVHGVARSRTRLSDFTFIFHFHALEKEMATHSSVLAWRIPGTEEPGRKPSMGSQRVGHD